MAVDLLREKLDLASRMGAETLINASEVDPVSAIREICKDGVDAAIEATGKPQVMVQALESVRARGGRAVVIGNASFGQRLELDPKQFNMGKSLLGTWGGDCRPDEDYPRFSGLCASGKLDLSPLVSKVYGLSEINEAIDDLEAGVVARPLIDMSMGEA